MNLFVTFLTFLTFFSPTFLTTVCFVGAEVMTDASFHSRSSSLDSSTHHHHHHQQQQQQQQPASHACSPTPTPSDESTLVTESTTKDAAASAMDAGKSTMWLGTDDGW